MATQIEEIRAHKANYPTAFVLAIGTANPPNCYHQADFPDLYFRTTQSKHLTNFKAKFKRICEKSMIEKRCMHLTQKILEENPNIGAYEGLSLDARQAIEVVGIPKLGKEAALRAIEEWGQPNSKITDLIFCVIAGDDMLGADYQLVQPLGLHSSIMEAFTPLNIIDWNSIFWILHPLKGRTIIDRVKVKIGLRKDKLNATRQVLKDYGNMLSACVFFIMGAMIKKSLESKQTTTGEGLEWGVLFGIGPGITVETVVLRSVPLT